MLERLELLIQKENIKKLNNLTVAVVGIGGVGGYTVESLVRCGIKKIIIIDYDTIDITNLNRQIIATKNNIGHKKVDEFAKRINEISDTEVVKIDKFLDASNIDILFDYHPDYVVDACDSINTKVAIIKKCLETNTKFISCMGAGNRLNPQLFKITDITKTSYDPLARKLRKILKDENITGKINVLYSMEQPIKSKPVASNSFVPAVAGLLITSHIVNEVIS